MTARISALCQMGITEILLKDAQGKSMKAETL